MIIVTGTIAYDFIIDFPGKFSDHILPDQIHKLNISFNVEKYAKRRGGTGANAYYSLGLLNTPAKLLAMAGKDFDEFRTVYGKLGLDTSTVIIDDTDNCSIGFAITDKNNNQIWGYAYGATQKAKDLSLSKVLTEDDFVLAGPTGVEGLMSIVEQCIAQNISYMFDPSFDLVELTNEQLQKGIEHASIVIANDYEMTLIKNRLTQWEKLFLGKTIITTLGGKGAEIVSGEKTYSIDVVKPQEFVDPTGAGDAWRAGFLAGFSRKFDLQTCGQMGAVAASFALEKYGTQEHVYTVEEFQERYRQSFENLLKL